MKSASRFPVPAAALLFALVLAGCRTEPDRPEQTETPAADAGPVLVLDPEGFRFVDPETGSARPLAFGTEARQAVAAVARVRGEPDERGTNADCALDFASWGDGLTVYASDGAFAGWAAGNPGSAAAGAYTTMAGVGVGSTRVELDAAYDALVAETTLGTEFEAGGLFGLLSGTGPEAVITVLRAGTSCTFR